MSKPYTPAEVQSLRVQIFMKDLEEAIVKINKDLTTTKAESDGSYHIWVTDAYMRPTIIERYSAHGWSVTPHNSSSWLVFKPSERKGDGPYR